MRTTEQIDIVDFSTISDKISNHYMPIVLNSKEDKVIHSITILSTMMMSI